MMLPTDPYSIDFNATDASGKRTWQEEPMNNTIRLSDLQNIKLDGIDRKDHPDYCDAFVSYAECKEGLALTDAELERIDGSDIQRAAIESVCGADVDTDMER